MSDIELPRLLDELRAFYRSNGYEIPPHVGPTDGKKPARFDPDDPKGDRCWIFINLLNHVSKPGQFIVATLGDWRDPEFRLTFKSETNYDPADKASIAAQLDQQRKRIAIETARGHRIAAERAAMLYGQGEARDHPYLKTKKLTALHGALVHGSDNALMIPMRGSEGKLWGLQRIYNHGKREKFFLAGQRVDATFHVIPDVDPCKEPTLILCEGFSTGASIHEATGRVVVVCFNAGNLVKVAQALGKECPEAAFIIAADDDRFGEKNTGEGQAEKASIACGGVVVKPSFPFSDDDSTDFNDLHVQLGLPAVKEQIERALMGHRPQYIRCLGTSADQYYLTSSDNKGLTATRSLSTMELLKLMPLAYWERRYPGKKGGVDWTLAASDLMDRCRQAGQYGMNFVRGRGVWLDQKKLVVHLGDRLWVDGRDLDLHGMVGSKYMYVVDERAPAIHPRPLTVDELAPWRDAVGLLRFRDHWARTFFLGWPVQAMLGGALRWRSHLHLTGESGSGKSTINDDILAKICSPLAIRFGGSATEPGIRNRIRVSAAVAIIDELESRQREAKARIELVLDYIRQSSSGAVVTKGAANGGFVEYSAYSTFSIASVADVLNKDTDATRFIQIHMLKRSNEPDQYRRLLEHLRMGVGSVEFGERLFARCVTRFPQFQKSQETFFDIIAKRHGERIAQLWSNVLAGWNLVESDEPISEAQAEVVVSRIDPSSEKSTSQERDWAELINHVLTVRVETTNNDGYLTKSTLGPLLSEARVTPTNVNPRLAQLGLRYIHTSEGRAGLFIQHNNAEFKKLLKGHHFEEGYQTILLRAPGAMKDQQRVGERRSRGVFLPDSLLSGDEA